MLNIPTVSGVSGVVRITKSASPRRSANRSGVARSAIPTGSLLTRGSMPSTRMPSAAHSPDASPPAPDQYCLLREIDHFGTPPPLLLRQVVIEAAGKGEQECDGVAGKMLVVAAAHVRDDDVTLDQLVIKPCTAEAGSVGANPAQFCSSRQQLRWHCAVGVT